MAELFKQAVIDYSVVNKSDADILAESLEQLEKGWTQGDLIVDGKVCSLGAIAVSQGWINGCTLKPERMYDFARLAGKILRVAGIGWSRHSDINSRINMLTQWNDDLEGENAKQVVLDTFAKAEKIERAGFDPDA